MKRHIPGVPSLLKELGYEEIGNFILPCVKEVYARWLFEEDRVCDDIDLDVDKFDSFVTEPYGKINMRMFSAVDPEKAEDFFLFLMSELDSKDAKKLTALNHTNFLSCGCRIQDLPKINEELLKRLEKLEEGLYFFRFTKFGHFDKIKEIDLSNPPLTKLPDHYFPRGWIGVFLNKRSDITETSVNRSSTVIYHHTFHTYWIWEDYNQDYIKGILMAGNKLGDAQIINLHRVGKEDAVREIFSISELRKLVEEIGFYSIKYAEVEGISKTQYRFNIRNITDPSEIEYVSTGNHRYLILKNLR
jgi:hypothetical protein